MGTYTNLSAKFPVAASTSTDARNYIVDQHSNIINSGWAVSSDTGQMDEATVTIPGTTNTTIGYRVYYLDDSYHATNPIYMKIVYGSGVGTLYRVSTTYQFGVSTNGTGSMSDWSSTLSVYNVVNSNLAYYSSTTGTFLGTYGEGYSVMLLGKGILNGNADTPVVSVQRAFNQQTGAVQDDGTFYVYLNQYSSAAFPASVQVTGFNRNYTQVISSVGTMCYSKSFVPMGTTYSGANVEIYPDIFRARVANISPITATYKLTDIAQDNYVTANILGANHTYRATGVIAPNSAQSASAYGLALIWE